MYEKTLYAGWGDMDFNSHMRNTAYLDKSADVRMLFFSENGFPMSEFVRRSIGPVITRDELEYFKEVGLLQTLQVTLSLAGLSEDGSRWSMPTLGRGEFGCVLNGAAARFHRDRSASRYARRSRPRSPS